MFTKEVNAWIQKIKKGNFSSWDIMEEFAQFSKYLTRSEMIQIKQKLDSLHKSSPKS